jgi:hypothetical protein
MSAPGSARAYPARAPFPGRRSESRTAWEEPQRTPPPGKTRVSAGTPAARAGCSGDGPGTSADQRDISRRARACGPSGGSRPRLPSEGQAGKQEGRAGPGAARACPCREEGGTSAYRAPDPRARPPAVTPGTAPSSCWEAPGARAPRSREPRRAGKVPPVRRGPVPRRDGTGRDGTAGHRTRPGPRPAGPETGGSEGRRRPDREVRARLQAFTRCGPFPRRPTASRRNGPDRALTLAVPSPLGCAPPTGSAVKNPPGKTGLRSGRGLPAQFYTPPSARPPPGLGKRSVTP